MKEINNSTLLKIADEFSTPLYVYHGEKIIDQYQRLKNAFPGVKVHLHYALKALNNINILKTQNLVQSTCVICCLGLRDLNRLAIRQGDVV